MKKIKLISNLFFIVAIIMIAAIWAMFGLKCVMLSVGLFSFLMFINISATSIANAMISRDFSRYNDVFWKILFIIMCSISIGIYFSI